MKKYSKMCIRKMLFDNEYISYVCMISVGIHVYGISFYNMLKIKPTSPHACACFSPYLEFCFPFLTFLLKSVSYLFPISFITEIR